MKLTGKWTPEERIVVVSAALVLLIRDKQLGNGLAEFDVATNLMLKVLHFQAEDLTEFVKPAQDLVDVTRSAVSIVPSKHFKWSCN